VALRELALDTQRSLVIFYHRKQAFIRDLAQAHYTYGLALRAESRLRKALSHFTILINFHAH
jgi:hypothetical protein